MLSKYVQIIYNKPMKKIKIAVLSGGPSSEHEVSLKSAQNIIRNLDSDKFDILDIKISKDGIWIDQATAQEHTEEDGLKYLEENHVDLVFIIIHGEYGEDGTIQKLLETRGLKFVGSGSHPSSVAMDKVASSRILSDSKLNVPSYISINIEEWKDSSEKFITAVVDAFSFPVVVKPVDRGSSVGITIVAKQDDLESALTQSFEYSNNVMAQEFIKGREFTCAVIEGANGEVTPLVPTEILFDRNHDFFDYSAKYVPGASIEVTPPNLPAEKISEIQRSAVRAHVSLNCSHISRSDFLLADDVLYILEVNTLPGMTETSLLPQGAEAAGIAFPMLLEILIEAALR